MIALARRDVLASCAAGVVASALPKIALAAPAPRTVAFADGAAVPALGLGSWHMTTGRAPASEVQAAMRLGISLGMTLIDTAEVYGGGRSETLIADVIAGQRDKVFLVSKVWPTHAAPADLERSCRASLERLKTDHLDLYLLHARMGANLPDTVAGFEHLKAQGLIKRWGVSNFGVKDMDELFAVPHGSECATNQVLYNLSARGIETTLLPWCREHKMPIMAYSPLGAGGGGSLLNDNVLKKLGSARGVSPAVIALAWAMRDGRTIAVTETGSSAHVREDAAALTLDLSAAEIGALDEAFPQPRAG